MQQCADVCAQESSRPFGPYTGANAWTFRPDYSVATYGAGTANGDTSEESREDEGRGGWGGTCSLGHVREPYYQTLTPHDNGAISGFALTSLSAKYTDFSLAKKPN